MTRRGWWVRLAAALGSAGCLGGAVVLARGTDPAPAALADHGHTLVRHVGYQHPPGRAAHRYAGRTGVFGLAAPGADPGLVRFAPAQRLAAGGPETVHPGAVGAYTDLVLAPDAVIRVTAPIVTAPVPDYTRGVQVTPEQFARLYRAALRQDGPFLDRGHMFELAFDAQGRVIRMTHYFSP